MGREGGRELGKRSVIEMLPYKEIYAYVHTGCPIFLPDIAKYTYVLIGQGIWECLYMYIYILTITSNYKYRYN